MLLQHTEPSEGLDRPSWEDPVASEALGPSLKSHRSNLKNIYQLKRSERRLWLAFAAVWSLRVSILSDIYQLLFISTLPVAGCIYLKATHSFFEGNNQTVTGGTPVLDPASMSSI